MSTEDFDIEDEEFNVNKTGNELALKFTEMGLDYPGCKKDGYITGRYLNCMIDASIKTIMACLLSGTFKDAIAQEGVPMGKLSEFHSKARHMCYEMLSRAVADTKRAMELMKHLDPKDKGDKKPKKATKADKIIEELFRKKD